MDAPLAIQFSETLLENTSLDVLSDRWTEQYKTHLSTMTPPVKWDFLVLTSQKLLEWDEQQIHVACSQKAALEEVTNEELDAMGVSRQEFLHSCRWEDIRQLCEGKAAYNHKRKQHVKRITAAWSPAWQESLQNMLPKETDLIKEGLLWGLAKVAEMGKKKSVPLTETVELFERAIKARQERRGGLKSHLLLPGDANKVFAQLQSEPGKVLDNWRLILLLIKELQSFTSP
jgi:hypothetical protein